MRANNHLRDGTYLEYSVWEMGFSPIDRMRKSPEVAYLDAV